MFDRHSYPGHNRRFSIYILGILQSFTFLPGFPPARAFTHTVTLITIRVASTSAPKARMIRLTRPLSVSERRSFRVITFLDPKSRSRVKISTPRFDTSWDSANLTYFSAMIIFHDFTYNPLFNFLDSRLRGNDNLFSIFSQHYPFGAFAGFFNHLQSVICELFRSIKVAFCG